MNYVKVTAALGLLAMTAALIYGFTAGDFFADGSVLTSLPWGIVSLVDLYVGFALFSGWIIYRENSLARALPWVVAMMILGFFAGSLYALIAALTCDGSWERFWLGRRLPQG